MGSRPISRSAFFAPLAPGMLSPEGAEMFPAAGIPCNLSQDHLAKGVQNPSTALQSSRRRNLDWIPGVILPHMQNSDTFGLQSHPALRVERGAFEGRERAEGGGRRVNCSPMP